MDIAVLLNMRNSNKTKKEIFPYSLMLRALLSPRALTVTELEISFLSSWVHHLLHPGERRKGDHELGLTKSRRRRGRRPKKKKKSFLKKRGGGKISRSLSCTYNTK